jgi:tetratricopeptide (TPR) repeat protein
MKHILRPFLMLLAAAPGIAGADGDPVTLYEHGSYRRAAAAAEQRIAANPADAVALGVLARVRAEQNRFDEAVVLGERAVKAAPGSADAHYALAETQGQVAESGGMMKGLGAARAFKREAEATLAIDPGHPEALASLIQFHRLAPGIVGGDRKKAAELTDRLVAADPVRGWFVRAQDALRAKDSTRAEQCWHRAAESESHGVRAKVALASWLASTERDIAGAERLATEAAEAEPWRIGAWQVLAGVQAHGRRWAELDATLAKSEAATDGRLEAWYTAARQMVVERVEPARAERYLRHYLEREPEIGSLSPAAARWRLALALEQQSRRPDAVAELRTALRLDPRFEPAKKDLKRLKG